MLIKQAFNGVFKVFDFYIQGFKQMKLGKTLWKLILIKLFVIFIIMKLFIFDENFNSVFKNDEAKSEFVLDNLIFKEKE